MEQESVSHGTVSQEQQGKPAQGRIGELLLKADLITEADLVGALAEQRHAGGRLGEVLIARGAVRGRILADVLARQLGIPRLDDQCEPTSLIPIAQAQRWRAIAVNDAREIGYLIIYRLYRANKRAYPCC